jgi:hypothetical protein
VRQALHIIRKDASYLRNEICLLVGLAIVFVLAAIHIANALWAELLLAVAATYLIARLIHAEAIPGDKQFWITRPYKWTSLLAAKLLGLVVFVHVPILMARLCVVLATGFPLQDTVAPLLWSQLLMFIGATVPIAALAAVTTGIVPFTFAGLILIAIAFGIDSSIMPPSLPSVRLLLSAMQWVWNSIAVLTFIAFGIPVLYIQYRKRWTFVSRCIIVCVAALGAAAYVYVPWPVAAAIEGTISAPRFDIGAVQVKFEPGAKRFFEMGMSRRSGVQIDVPIAIRGIADDVEVIADGVLLTFQAADGTTWTTGPYKSPALAKQSPGPGATVLNANVDVPAAFFDRSKQQRVRLTGSLYITAFGNPRATTIPIQTTPVNVSDGLQCSISVFQYLSCRSAFRWPARLVYAKFRDGGMVPFTRLVSYSPVPGGLDLFTVESREVSLPSGEREVTIVVTERLGSFHRDFEIDDFPLSNFGQRVRGSNRRE